MTISIAAGPLSTLGTTRAWTTVAIGNAVVVTVQSGSASTAMTDTSSRISWNAITVDDHDASNGEGTMWYGVVTSVGTTTITPTGGSVTEVTAYELHDTVSTVWTVAAASSKNNTTGTSIVYPTLTSGGSGSQAYIGYAFLGSSYSGTTALPSGFTGFATANGNAALSGLNLAASTGFSPTETQASSGFSDTSGAIFVAGASAGGTGVPNLLMAPMRGRY